MTPQEALRDLVRKDRARSLDDPAWVRGMLSDWCPEPEHRMHANLLVLACREGVGRDLAGNVGRPIETFAIARLVSRLVDDHAIADEHARWAVKAWANALEVETLQVKSVRLTPKPARQVVPPSIRVNVTKSDVIAHPDTSQVPARRSRVWVGGLISVVVGAAVAASIVVSQSASLGSGTVTFGQVTQKPSVDASEPGPTQPISGNVANASSSGTVMAGVQPMGAQPISDAPPNTREIASPPLVRISEAPKIDRPSLQPAPEVPVSSPVETEPTSPALDQGPAPNSASQASLSATSATPPASSRISAPLQSTSLPSRGGSASTPTAARTPPTQQPTSVQTGLQQPDQAIPPPSIKPAPEPTTTPQPTTPPEPTTAPQPTAPPEPTTATQPTAPPEPTAVPTTASKVGAIPTDTRAPSPSPAPTDTRVPSPSPAPTDTRVPTPTVAPTETRAPTPTTAPTNTRVPTQTPVPSATVDRSPTIAPTVQLSRPTISSPSMGARIIKGQSATIAWSSVSRASGYQVEISNEDDPNAGGSFTVSGTSYTYTFGSGGFWNLRVRALGAEGQLPGPPSSNVRIVVPY